MKFMKTLEQETLSSIALAHHQVIPVLEKYSLDFCCRGKKTLSEACAEKSIPLQNVINEMREATNISKPVMPFTEMTAEQLISHIVTTHHFYVKNTMPVILGQLQKLVSKHGERYPHLGRVLQLFTAVKNEMDLHMVKEEQVLFPRIKEVAASSLIHNEKNFPAAYISGPIEVMESEHDHAGQSLFEIRDLTNHYTPPEDACTTHRVCLEALKVFEADLHQHVHLENNILFPMAVEMCSPRTI
jgi:regulator of cell morphogenesis and NO signaling